MTTRKIVGDAVLHLDVIRANRLRIVSIVADEVKLGEKNIEVELERLRKSNRELRARMDFLEEALRYAPGGVEASRAKEHFQSLHRSDDQGN